MIGRMGIMAWHANEVRVYPGMRVLRWTLAILLGIHGVTRILHGSVHGFGDFLSNDQHIPFGHGLAWAITLFEISGALALLIGRWIVPVACLLITELATGIAMVHFKEGWFVVGGGFNGMEYSVLLIMSLLTLAISSWNSSRIRSG
jgi:putative oxidoreductase